MVAGRWAVTPGRWYRLGDNCPVFVVRIETRAGYSVMRGLRLQRDGVVQMQTYQYRQACRMVLVPRPDGGDVVEARALNDYGLVAR